MSAQETAARDAMGDMANGPTSCRNYILSVSGYA